MVRRPLYPCRFSSFCAVVVSSLLAAACADENETAVVSTRIVVPGVTEVSGGAVAPTSFGGGRVLHPLGAGDIGANAAPDLVSLQYYVTSIALCESIVVQGSGYNNTSGCVSVYTAEDADRAYDAFKVAQAAADTSNGWVDLMSAASLARVAASSTDLKAGKYNYVLVENRKPVKVHVRLGAPNAPNLRTCAGGAVEATGAGMSLVETTVVEDMTSCPEGLATVGTMGGGNWFKLARPIEIQAGKRYFLDLGFDPDSAVLGGLDTGSVSSMGGFRDKLQHFIAVPKIAVAPVVRAAGNERTVREQYELSGIAGFAGKLRVNLYFAGTEADVGRGAIQGVEVRFLDDASASGTTSVEKAYEIVESGGVVTLKDYQGRTIVADLRRSANPAAGAAGVATVGLEALTTAGRMPTVGMGTSSATATFKGVLSL